MDFFGNVQGVEIEAEGRRVSNESEWKEDLRRLGEIWRRARESEDRREGAAHGKNQSVAAGKPIADSGANQATTPSPRSAQESYYPNTVKIQLAAGWVQQILGAGALVACAVLWGGAWWLEGNLGKGGRGGGGDLKRNQNSKKT